MSRPQQTQFWTGGTEIAVENTVCGRHPILSEKSSYAVPLGEDRVDIVIDAKISIDTTSSLGVHPQQ